MRSGRRVALFTSLLSVAAFDFFCVPPHFTFAVDDYEYLVTFAVMLIVSAIISSLTVSVRTQAAQAVDREARTQALYRLSRKLSGETRVFEVARIATQITREVFDAKVVIFLPDEQGKVSFRRRTTGDLPVPSSEEGIVQWVLDHGQKAGKGMDTLPGAAALYLPLKGSQSVLGVMAILPDASDLGASPEKRHLLEVFAGQTAVAMERALAAAAAHDAEVRIHAEQMRSSLLSAVSHDLRTPLASITGAASSLLSHSDSFDPATRRELLESIADEAERLERLVSNLLEMTRLESGAAEVRRDWHSLEEIVGAALTRLDRPLRGRPVAARLPPGLPLVLVDDVLLQQVFINLLENAVKYTPAGSPVEIAAWQDGGEIRIDVMDRGPGFTSGEEIRVFEKFYRGKADSASGAGLGLAICRAIVTAHGGTIEGVNRAGGGAVIRIRLPVGGVPPNLAPQAEGALNE